MFLVVFSANMFTHALLVLGVVLSAQHAYGQAYSYGYGYNMPEIRVSFLKIALKDC